MNIAIDTSPLSSGHRTRGTGVYTRCLVDALKVYVPEHTYQLLTTHDSASKHVDLIHYPYFDPYFLTLPWKRTAPTVVTVHDLIPLVFRDKFPSGIRGQVKWSIQKKLLSTVSRIITDSKSSKKDIVQITGIAEEKIDVIYLAPAPTLKPVANPTDLRKIQKKYNLPKEYVLYVGDVNWNKNIMGLLEGIAKTNVPLMLVGKAFVDESLREVQEVNAQIKLLHLEDRVYKLGYVPDDELRALYSLALCLVQPSWYEGFGLPVLEAFACGCPVIASNNSSLVEIRGPSFSVDPGDSESISDAIKSVQTFDVKKRQQIIREGFSWVRQFTWEKTAKETASVYERCLG